MKHFLNLFHHFLYLLVLLLDLVLQKVNFFSVLLPRDQSCDFISDPHPFGHVVRFTVEDQIIAPKVDVHHRVAVKLARAPFVHFR